MSITIDCFKAYDVRGRIPDQLNADVAYRIGNATAEYLGAKSIVLCRDIRHSSDELSAAVARGLTEAGCDVLDIGVGGTEMVYFGTSELGADGGIMVTASHNPADYNGLKMVREESKPISGDTGLDDIRKIAERDERLAGDSPGEHRNVDATDDYIRKLLSFVDPATLTPLKIVVNAGNGAAGPTLDLLEPHLPFEFIKVHHEPNGDFPNGVPNPMIVENRAPTIDAIRDAGADLGIAWDGDFDRCFFFDENGRFIEGYYLVGLLAQSLLAEHPGEAVIYDPRLVWNTIETVAAQGGRPVQSKSGHSFIKEVMRSEDAVYGGEMSAHHYFRDFYYCDSGMVPWLLVAQLLCKSESTFSSLVDAAMERFPTSGEINREVPDAAAAIKLIRGHYESDAISVDTTDGVSIVFDDWRFNLRASNTEPVIRLNVETRGDERLMEAKRDELLALLDGLG
ncbi:MAG: phosphomannomutase CpsG [Gammaproteobacteria bacterium]|nr:phosphomannomutase CpsG [Gammaproteobacteria bacterium]